MDFEAVNLAPNVLPQAAIVATGAPIDVTICFYGHSRGDIFLVIHWTLTIEGHNSSCLHSASPLPHAEISIPRVTYGAYAAVRRWPAVSVNQPARRR